MRFYDMAPLAELERAAGLAEGTTARVAFAPEVDLPLLLGQITKKEWVDSIASVLSDQVPQMCARQLGMALADAPFRADDAVVTLLRLVRRHMPLVLVTNATLELERDLETMGLADLADHVVSSARVGVAKPDRKIYEIAARRAGTAVSRCLFVDDRLENVEAANSLGMTGVHYRELADLQKALSSVLDS
ncbi:HAD family hydrolase [Streptomyces gamaensis]|uniref:HAD family hydrolase n=1 Tax=Streptomyces gamaensis TaxID=1763542 RepID=A0ABW0YVT6_9ACTN